MKTNEPIKIQRDETIIYGSQLREEYYFFTWKGYCCENTKKRWLIMDKNKILQFVAQLQELRDNVEDFMYFSTIPVEHLEINFNEGMDRAVEAVLFLYGEIVLDEIQRKKVSN